MPFKVAAFEVSAEAADVVTDGVEVVVNDSTVPNDVPTEFEAMAQK